MKKQGHPPYQEVLFVDSATGFKFVCGSTLQPKEKEAYQGKEYPVYRLAVSSASHPFFTGSKQFVDSEGRVDKFNKRYIRKAEKVAEPAPVVEEKKEPKKAVSKKTATEKTAPKTTKKTAEKKAEGVAAVEKAAPKAEKAPKAKKESAPKEEAKKAKKK